MIGPIPRPTLLSTLIMFGGLCLFHVFRSVCQCLPTVRSKFRGGCRQQSSRLAELQYHIGQSFVSRSWRGALIVDAHRLELIGLWCVYW